MALDQNAVSRRLSGKTQYDLKRESLEAKGAKEREALSKETGAVATEKGFGTGSGYAEALKRKADIESRRQTGARIGAVDIQELGAQESRDESERQRTWGTSERREGQTWQSGEAGKTRAYGQAMAKEEQKWGTSERLGAESAAIGLADLNNLAATGRLNLQNTFDINAETRKARASDAYNAGLTGRQPDISWSAAENAMYNAGQSGKSKEDADREYEASIDKRNAVLFGLDPEVFKGREGDYQAIINTVFSGGKLWNAGGTESSDNPYNPYNPDNPEGPFNEGVTESASLRTGIKIPRGVNVGSTPEAASGITYTANSNGNTYNVSGQKTGNIPVESQQSLSDRQPGEEWGAWFKRTASAGIVPRLPVGFYWLSENGKVNGADVVADIATGTHKDKNGNTVVPRKRSSGRAEPGDNAE